MVIRNLSRRVFRGTLVDGAYKYGPSITVPPHINRPHERISMPFAARVVPSDLAAVRNAAKIAASALALAKDLTKVGTTTEQIDNEVAEYIVSRNAYPSGIGFMGFPKAICQSVNEIIAHGIPDSRPLENGDIVNFDITAYKDGCYGDNSDTFLVGDVDQDGKRLVETVRESLHAAISICRPGQKFSRIADEISRIADREGYGIVAYFCGHFIGREMHIAPNIHHTTNIATMEKLEMAPGMVFTIEPILTEGSPEGEVWEDGWTYVTKDKGRTAQAEHMVLITNDGYEILTIPDEFL